AGVCDECRGQLSQRADDQPATVNARLETNRAWTEALAEYYGKQGKLEAIDGTGSPDDITARLEGALVKVS
ncbi:MAG: adenylate kinase, partial [Chloroflexi bacterium]